MSNRSELHIYAGRICLGRVVRSGVRTVYAYDARGVALGIFEDLDAAIRALTERRAA
jgi:hypothetical protein